MPVQMSTWNLKARSVIDILGSVALLLNLISMNMTSMRLLRLLALLGNALFAIYGLLLGATPILIAAGIAVGIHGYHLFKITKPKKQPI